MYTYISIHSTKCVTFFLVYFLLLTAETWAFLNFVDLFAKWQTCNEKGCEREAKWHPFSQFKAWYLVVYNLSMLVVCTMIRAFLVWRLSDKTYCSNADSVCLLVREMDRKAGRSGSSTKLNQWLIKLWESAFDPVLQHCRNQLSCQTEPEQVLSHKSVVIWERWTLFFYSE